MGRPKRTIEQCQDYAQAKGGECLATLYINEDEKMLWRCAHDHVWQATAASVIGAKSWCKACADEASGKRRRNTMEDCHALAALRGGWCLATEYKGNKTKMKWKCACGNIWLATYNSVHNGTWCIKCANERKRRANHLGINKMHELAAKHHGKCLSKTYDNVNSILEWECSEGHQFPARAANVIAGNWCYKCGKGLSERLCRAIMEHLYSAKFPLCRPKWLLSAAQFRMELDGYNEGLALAFEYQGIQHYKTVLKFKLDNQRLLEIQKHDRLKAILCESRKTTLIEIPYTVSHDNLEAFIRKALQLQGKALIHWKHLPHLNLWDLSVRADSRLATVKQTGDSKHLECLSKSYLGHDTPLQWRCKACGQEFCFRPDRLTKVAEPCEHCRKAAYRQACEQKMLRNIRALLNSRGEILLSSRFTSQNTALAIRCSQGHEWNSSWASLRHGTHCKHCRTQTVTPPDSKHETPSPKP